MPSPWQSRAHASTHMHTASRQPSGFTAHSYIIVQAGSSLINAWSCLCVVPVFSSADLQEKLETLPPAPPPAMAEREPEEEVGKSRTKGRTLQFSFEMFWMTLYEHAHHISSNNIQNIENCDTWSNILDNYIYIMINCAIFYCIVLYYILFHLVKFTIIYCTCITFACIKHIIVIT